MKYKSIIYILAFIVLCIPVFAAVSSGGYNNYGSYGSSSFGSVFNLNMIFNPFVNVDFGTFYLMYYRFIDAIIYLLFFMGISKMVFQKIYVDKETKKDYSKPIVVGLGLALSFAMIVFESTYGFNLGSLSPIAGIVFFLVLSALLFNLLKLTFEDSVTAFCVAYLLMYGVLVSVFNFLYLWINQNIAILAALLNITTIIAFIVLLIRIFGLISDDKKKNGNSAANGYRNAAMPGDSAGRNPEGQNLSEPEKQKKPQPKVQIKYPYKIPPAKFMEKTPIQFIFETSNVEAPYHYWIKAIDRSNERSYDLVFKRWNYSNVDIKALKVDGAKDLAAGNYRIIVQLFDHDRRPLTNQESGEPVLDAVDISIMPSESSTANQHATEPATQTSQGTPSSAPAQKMRLELINGPTYSEGDEIGAVIRTENVPLPFTYGFYLHDKSINKQLPLHVYFSKSANVERKNLKIRNQDKIPAGKYYLIAVIFKNKASERVQSPFVIDPVSGKGLIDQKDIEVLPKSSQQPTSAAPKKKPESAVDNLPSTPQDSLWILSPRPKKNEGKYIYHKEKGSKIPFTFRSVYAMPDIYVASIDDSIGRINQKSSLKQGQLKRHSDTVIDHIILKNDFNAGVHKFYVFILRRDKDKMTLIDKAETEFTLE
jgi:hypothetical protein